MDVNIKLPFQTAYDLGTMVRITREKLEGTNLQGAMLAGILSALATVPVRDAVAVFDDFMRGYSGLSSDFTVYVDFSQCEKKINAIKEVRAVTGLGLKEAKDLVEGNRIGGNIYRMPVVVQRQFCSYDRFKSLIEETGARVTA